MDNSQLQYKCPCCGGQIEFDSSTQNMKCPYCDSEFDVESLRGYDEILNKEKSDNFDNIEFSENTWSEEDSDGLNLYVCDSCGGEIVAEATTAATHCPYCDNPIVLSGRVSGDLKPDLIIPFKLDKKAAKEALTAHLKGKILLPKVFKDENHIDEIKGLYVPFWLYNAEADADIRFRGTKIRTWSDSRYHYTETSYYSILRSGTLAFQDIPADGSSKIDNDLMESIEPFDKKDVVDFQTAYLSGYIADRYDVSAEELLKRASERMKSSTESSFRSTVHGYTGTNIENSNVRINSGKARYALYPVWILNTTWRDKKYTFAMNGQTGKFVGNLPVDNKLYFLWLLGITAGSMAIGILLTLLSSFM